MRNGIRITLYTLAAMLCFWLGAELMQRSATHAQSLAGLSLAIGGVVLLIVVAGVVKKKL